MSKINRPASSGLKLLVYVQPNAQRSSLAGQYGDAIKVKVAARATAGRANAETCRFLAQVLGVAPSNVRLLSGARGRRKRIRVDGVSPENVHRLIAGARQ